MKPTFWCDFFDIFLLKRSLYIFYFHNMSYCEISLSPSPFSLEAALASIAIGQLRTNHSSSATHPSPLWRPRGASRSAVLCIMILSLLPQATLAAIRRAPPRLALDPALAGSAQHPLAILNQSVRHTHCSTGQCSCAPDLDLTVAVP